MPNLLAVTSPCSMESRAENLLSQTHFSGGKNIVQAVCDLLHFLFTCLGNHAPREATLCVGKIAFLC